MPHQGVLQQVQARPLGFNELQVRWLGQVREIGMPLGSQVQLLRSGDKGKGAFRKETTSALPCSMIVEDRAQRLPVSQKDPCGKARRSCTQTSQVSADPNAQPHSSAAGPPPRPKPKGPPCCPPPQPRCRVTCKVPLSSPVPPAQWVAVPTLGQTE